MNKPKKIRQIYAELQRVYGGDIPALELLECAALFVSATEDSIMPAPKTGMHGRTPFVELPVHEVIEQWGWRIVCQEYFEEDDFEVQIPQGLLIEQTLAMAA
jgi:hypothetical protein